MYRGECGISRAKTSEPIVLPFAMMSEVGKSNRLLNGRAY